VLLQRRQIPLHPPLSSDCPKGIGNHINPTIAPD
jgi:hypothetical protein